MIIDLTEYSGPLDLQCDLCIIGAGAAGLSVALQFVGQDKKVMVLEGGGLDYSEESQRIYQGTNIGRPYHQPDTTRLRYLGGTTNHWGGWCRPLDSLDFKTKAWVPHSGWPIDKNDIEPYLSQACEILDLGEPEFSPQGNIPSNGSYLSLNPNLLAHRLWRGSNPPTKFKDKYHGTLKRAENIHVFLYANVNDIRLSDNHTLTKTVHVVAPGNKKIQFSADAFILALGGLENPRLLLNANSQITPGIGNRYDRVGRFFMEHPEGPSARIALHDPGIFDAPYRWFSRGVLAGICVSERGQERFQSLNHSATFEEISNKDKNSEAVGFPRDIQEMMGEVPDSRNRQGKKNVNQNGLLIQAYTRTEQAPNPDSRVKLTDEVDRLSLRRIAVDWRLTKLDQHTIRVANQLLAQELGRLGVGRMWLPDWLFSDSLTWSYSLRGGHHHMGTTRMSEDPQKGVVDKNCRVHDLENLFIAGSSVFPTGGSANPTLTITQLALRLAGHLKQQMA